MTQYPIPQGPIPYRKPFKTEEVKLYAVYCLKTYQILNYKLYERIGPARAWATRKGLKEDEAMIVEYQLVDVQHHGIKKVK
jgi:hypothetical protein